MFVIGLFVGPALGLLAGDYLFRPGGPGRAAASGSLVALILILAVLPIFALELKLGLILGLIVGALLALSPVDMREPADSL